MIKNLPRHLHRHIPAFSGAFLLLLVAACGQAPQATVEQEAPQDSASKIPVTTDSDAAREAFLIGRDLNERLRATDAHEHFLKAVELDPSFAWAHLLAGFTGSTAQEFWDHLESAVEATGTASDGERLLVLAAEAGAKGHPDEQIALLTQLVAAFPSDERAHNALGAVHFGRQEYGQAIEHYRHAIDINPEFSQPYNQKGYAHRFLADFEAAEASFQKYVELIPDDPNPYDSYAELLMKMGRFEEAIGKYEQALEQNPNFVASYVGIANNQILMGDPQAARATLEELSSVARNVGESRAALLWKARSYLHEGKYDEALETCGARLALAEADDDQATIAGDLNLVGDILLEAGRLDEATDSYAKSIEAIEKAAVSDDVKENVKRNILFDQARVALAGDDLQKAKETATSYGEMVEVKKIPFEVRQAHELMAMIALAEGKPDGALAHLEQANQQNPRVLLLTAQAHQGLGRGEDARAYCEAAADFNALSGTYAFVRPAAQEMLAGM
ncbi:MAG: tetratricopeptide repeat protein [Acidobacteriota bacterium]|nr:tetratricopeptide repeat protein [Acidobacteriota bacterium]